MKIQLIYKEDFEGNWYNIAIDGSVIKSFKEHPGLEMETLKTAQDEFDRIKEIKIKEAVIREEEL